ncbi:TIGR04219 family outer membrane beta-barrel protein [Vibrio sp. S4M6]|uniref:TIGR04219 family outer membrane beta-barrel protein n=1 Tax=Vibrio sinus TaxID=2946865 RepID=UPI00202A6D64|nr:TIGR04219 family outer membrane beta-barrel protein [Vibrio sinus]MCL9783867.1 TIGR04219 family outer membrane beta-barrel protein [Vibrio sinus]
MDRVAFAAFASAVVSLAVIPSAFADSPYAFKAGTDIWWGSTKIDNTRRDDADSPSVYIAYHPSRSALPDISYRYTSVDGGNFSAFDKHDLSLYYNVVSHELMTFDVGITGTQYTDTHYRRAGSSTAYEFNDFTVNLYSYAEINIPESEWHIIGQFEVGNMNGIKSTDFIAGLRYEIPFDSMSISFRGGYRVIDLEFSELVPSSTTESFVFVDGYFLGTEIRF